MSIFERKAFSFKKNLVNPNEFKGKSLICTCCGAHEPKRITIEGVRGSMVRPTRFEVDDGPETHWVVMLDFYAQMNKEKIAPEVIEEFDRMEYHVGPAADEKELQDIVDQAMKEGFNGKTH